MATKKSPATKKNPESPKSPVQVLKEANCPTSSGKSILGYQVGTDDSGAIYLKVASNDGGGFFSNEWIAFTDIQAALTEWPEDRGVTSIAFSRTFSGRSSNTPGFLIAVLCAEGILEPMADKKRVHQACDAAPFLASVEELRKEACITTGKKPAAKATPKVKTVPKAKAKSPRKATAKTAKTPRKPPAHPAKGNSSTNSPPLAPREYFGRSLKKHFYKTTERKAP